VVADVASGCAVGRGEIPRIRSTGAERAADRDPPPLALPDRAIQAREIPPGGDLPPQLLGQPGRRWVAGQVGSLVRVGRKVVELVRVGRRVDELVPSPADHDDGRDRPLGQVLGHRLVAVRRAGQVRQQAPAVERADDAR
jgi:hypothetical protein